MSTTEEATRVGERVSARGRKIYEEQLKAALEPGETGRFVAVEPESGRYFLGDTDAEALLAAHEAMPECRFYLRRVGHDYTHKLGGHGLTRG